MLSDLDEDVPNEAQETTELVKETRERTVSFGAENSAKTYQKTTFHHPSISIFPAKMVLDSTAYVNELSSFKNTINQSEALDPSTSHTNTDDKSTDQSESTSELSTNKTTQHARLVRVDSQLSDSSAMTSGMENNNISSMFKKNCK